MSNIRPTDEIERLRAERADMALRIQDLGTEIERLRAERADMALRISPAERYWEGRWRDEKAENERLLAEIGRLEGECSLERKQAKIDEQRTEIGRLRASLLRVLGGPPRPGGEEMSNIIRRLQVWDNAGYHKFITLTRDEIAELLVEIERVRFAELERLREQAEIERRRHFA